MDLTSTDTGKGLLAEIAELVAELARVEAVRMEYISA